MNRRQALLAAAALAPTRQAAAVADATAALAWPVLTLLDGRRLVPADWLDQAAVVVFWATWCPFCKRHNARVEALHRAVQGQRLRVLGLAIDHDADLVRRTVTERGWTFPVALDDGVLRARLTSRRVLPTTCVVDRSGRLAQVIPGEMAEDDVRGLARIAQRAPG